MSSTPDSCLCSCAPYHSPCIVMTRRRPLAWSLCSHSQMPCVTQVHYVVLPSCCLSLSFAHQGVCGLPALSAQCSSECGYRNGCEVHRASENEQLIAQSEPTPQMSRSTRDVWTAEHGQTAPDFGRRHGGCLFIYNVVRPRDPATAVLLTLAPEELTLRLPQL